MARRCEVASTLAHTSGTLTIRLRCLALRAGAFVADAGIDAMLTPPSLSPRPELAVPPRPRPRRSWQDKFRDAFRGLKLGIRGHSSFSVHFFFAALVLATAVALRCDVRDWCILLGCIG